MSIKSAKKYFWIQDLQNTKKASVNELRAVLMKHYYPLECRATARATSPEGFHATDRVCAQDIGILIRSYLRLINQLAAN